MKEMEEEVIVCIQMLVVHSRSRRIKGNKEDSQVVRLLRCLKKGLVYEECAVSSPASLLKGIFHPKIKIQSISIHPLPDWKGG